jgi:glutaminyl-tRNA synthetase
MIDNPETSPVSHFIREFVEADLASGKHAEIVTRFPPEPNGYLHIGHAKSICLNFGLAQSFGGRCHLRFDDTNPCKEDLEYERSIMDDVRWLGFEWGSHLYYASNYFQQMVEYAVQLIKAGKAYVDSSTADEIRHRRGTLTEPGTPSPYRDRSVEENLALFETMKAGGFADGACVLRAKIDMAAPNINFRDPVLYRVLHAAHHRTGDTWCIYPMYDFAHGFEDALEGITHSICTLEFEDHRPLYDWLLDQVAVPCHPRQIEFARLNLTYTVMSKRFLLELVQSGFVCGWDDPRLPTLAGLRRRGVTPEAIRHFCEGIGVAKANSTVDIELFHYYLREDLNKRAQRMMAVLRPLKLIIDNYPEGQTEEIEADNNPEDPSAGTRKVPFSRELYIEQEDFKEVPPKGYFRLSPGQEVRLKHAYYITAQQVVKDAAGNVTEVHCTYDPESRGGGTPDGRRIKGTLHWVSAPHAVKAEVRLYDHLFTKPNPSEGGNDFKEFLNPNALDVVPNALVEPGLRDAKMGTLYQFMRQGYFCVDPDSTPEALVFNRTVTLKDTWAKMEKKAAGPLNPPKGGLEVKGNAGNN